MGTVATLRYPAAGVSGGSSVLGSGLVRRDENSQDIKELRFDFAMAILLLQRMSVANTEAYLAVARMCSYLGDHRTDRTSALCPTDRKGALKHKEFSSTTGKCSYVVDMSTDPARHGSLNQISSHRDGLWGAWCPLKM